MNHASINTSDLFVIFMCCGSSIYSLTVTKVSMVIPRKINGYGIERSCVHNGAENLDIWSPSGAFSWWIERLLLGSQKEYLGYHIMDIE